MDTGYSQATTVEMWKEKGVITYAGYILGLPTDTPETLRRDIEIVQRELPVDLLEFTVLTPLPGSEDHKNLYLKQVWLLYRHSGIQDKLKKVRKF